MKKQRQEQLAGQAMLPEPQAWSTETIFKLADDVHVLNYDIPRPACILRKTSTNLDLEINDGFQPILALLDGQHSLQEITQAMPVAQGQGLGGRLQGFAADVLAESAVDFLSGLKEQGFVVMIDSG